MKTLLKSFQRCKKTLIFIILSLTGNYIGLYFGIEALEIVVPILLAFNSLLIKFALDIWEDYKIQIGLINNLDLKLELMLDKVKGFGDEIKTKKVSAYPINNIEFEFYYKKISYKLLNKPTRNILKYVAKVEDKIELLNKSNTSLKDLKTELNNASFAEWREQTQETIDKLSNYSIVIIEKELIPTIKKLRKELEFFYLNLLLHSNSIDLKYNKII